jgi:hypothetical protein
LKDLNISCNKLTFVDSTILAKAVRELASINLGNTGLTTLQIETMFKSLNEESKLKWLNMESNDLSMVDQNLLAKTICRLEVVNLKKTKITINQLSNIFTLVTRTSRVRTIILDTDLVMQVDPQIIEHSKFIFK